MEAPQPSPSAPRSWGTRVGVGLATIGVAALGVLIARELLPRHAVPHAPVAAREAAESPAVTATASPAPVTRHETPKATAAPTGVATVAAPPQETASAQPSAPHVPLAASVIAGVAANPESFAPSHVFAPPAGHDQVFNYEPLPPFNSTTLKRTRANPAAWELDAMHGPKLNDLGPEGAVRQAALVKDSVGNETPWYAIDSGPLAPAYAVMQGSSLRVMSRAYLVENRASLPADVAAALDKVN